MYEHDDLVDSNFPHPKDSYKLAVNNSPWGPSWLQTPYGRNSIYDPPPKKPTEPPSPRPEDKKPEEPGK